MLAIDRNKLYQFRGTGLHCIKLDGVGPVDNIPSTDCLVAEWLSLYIRVIEYVLHRARRNKLRNTFYRISLSSPLFCQMSLKLAPVDGLFAVSYALAVVVPLQHKL